MLLLSVGKVALILLYFVDISVQQSNTHWDALNVTVQGRLVRGIPLSRPCFMLSNGTGGDFDAEECSIVIQNYLNECTNHDFLFNRACVLKRFFEAVRMNTFSAYMNVNIYYPDESILQYGLNFRYVDRVGDVSDDQKPMYSRRFNAQQSRCI